MNSLSIELSKDNNKISIMLNEIMCYARESAATGTAAHVVEKKIFKSMLDIGHEILKNFFEMQGTGDLGEKITLPNGQTVKKLEDRRRTYRSVLGDFTLARAVYGVREGQAIEFIPLDTRLQLPAQEYSYPLQEFIEILTTDVSYNTAKEILKKMLHINTTVDSMERVIRAVGESVENFRKEQLTPSLETEGTFMVISADGKGVPIRHSKDVARIMDQRSKTGPKPDRKRMAVVGAAYTIDPYVRTAEEIVEALFHEPNKEEPLMLILTSVCPS